MADKLSSIKTTREKYFDIVYKEIKKLKTGYGISISEMADKCGLSKRQFRDYEFTSKFKTEKHNNKKYFVK